MHFYDYYISLPVAPAFVDNISAAIELVSSVGGESPTTYANPASTPEVPLSAIYKPMHGTKADTGRAMLHFRMPVRHDAASLLVFLESVMTGSKPPMTVEAIRSAQPTIEVIIDDVVTLEYEVIVEANKAKFLPYMRDIPDGTVDGQGIPNLRPPTLSDRIFLSHYLGSTPIETI